MILQILQPHLAGLALPATRLYIPSGSSANDRGQENEGAGVEGLSLQEMNKEHFCGI